ncbi:hypothetical protein CEXT_784661 [Caerostris extrusa]|uniref:Endonuclease/exonuclease/phosphatase domain-containing protein n=1 Tax=Caerostris extrusa TaxID=172846 RepID=A0AAV4R4I1_CAEEX|nr:hypothetical protein CEXT_784661 [Caerostris extrusa]
MRTQLALLVLFVLVTMAAGEYLEQFMNLFTKIACTKENYYSSFNRKHQAVRFLCAGDGRGEGSATYPVWKCPYQSRQSQLPGLDLKLYQPSEVLANFFHGIQTTLTLPACRRRNLIIRQSFKIKGIYDNQKGQAYHHWRRTCFLVKTSEVKYIEVLPNFPPHSTTEAQAINILLPEHTITVINAYHPDTAPIDTLFLQDLASTIVETKILFGHLNAKNPSWDNNLLDAKGKQIEDLIDDLNLTILNTGEITFVSKTNGTASALHHQQNDEISGTLRTHRLGCHGYSPRPRGIPEPLQRCGLHQTVHDIRLQPRHEVVRNMHRSDGRCCSNFAHQMWKKLHHILDKALCSRLIRKELLYHQQNDEISGTLRTRHFGYHGHSRRPRGILNLFTDVACNKLYTSSGFNHVMKLCGTCIEVNVDAAQTAPSKCGSKCFACTEHFRSTISFAKTVRNNSSS